MPTKQEEIREGAIISLMNSKGFHRAPYEYIVDHLAKYYASQGVVIKDSSYFYGDKELWSVEPLIKEQEGKVHE